MSELNMRQQEIADLANGPGMHPAEIEYSAEENGVWRTISRTLAPKWTDCVIQEVLEAREQLALPLDEIPQLGAISAKLHGLSGFEFRAVPGLVDKKTFFGSLAQDRFLSTQYIRSAETPFYTEQPDIVHEVIGHATLLASPDFAQLHRLAGAAVARAETQEAQQFIADVWWFSGEFGVIEDADRFKAFGAGLLSSVGELAHMREAEIVPLNIGAMGLTKFRIDQFQNKLFAGQSVAHIMDEVGGFFDRVDDEEVARLIRETKI